MKCAELLELSLSKVRQYAIDNPGHIGAVNALRELERREKARQTLIRLGKNTATRSGRSRCNTAGRCPTKRSLR